MLYFKFELIPIKFGFLTNFEKLLQQDDVQRTLVVFENIDSPVTSPTTSTKRQASERLTATNNLQLYVTYHSI